MRVSSLLIVLTLLPASVGFALAQGGSGSAPIAGSSSPSGSSGTIGGPNDTSTSGVGGVGGGKAPSGSVGALYGGTGPTTRGDGTTQIGSGAAHGTGSGPNDMTTGGSNGPNQPSR